MSTPPPHSAALRALQLPFTNGALQWPQHSALFLHAQPGWPWRGFSAEQPFKQAADELLREGRATQVRADGPPEAGAGDAPLVLLLPPRQRDELRALFARALDACSEGGMVVASVANDAGAKSAEADLRKLAGGLEGTLSKHHCRVFWARKDATRTDTALLAQWRSADAPRRIAAPQVAGGGFQSRPGVFAWDRIDPASALLAAQLPGNLRGHGADLGAGWGFLALEVLARNPNVQALDLYEADARALELARHNLAEAGSEAALEFHWHDVTTGLPRSYDFIVSNPPFHAHDAADRPELGQRFIGAASQALRKGGRLYLVANRHLPYEAALAAGFGQVRELAQRNGFKVIEAVRT
jgi:16S rRNA (guanine1207-N2)-methyltransferase